jgi:hypothetical protein
MSSEKRYDFEVIDFSIHSIKLLKKFNKKDYFEYVSNDFFIKTKEGQKPRIEDYFEYVLFKFLVKTDDGQRLDQDDFFPHLREQYFDRGNKSLVKNKINREIWDMLKNSTFKNYFYGRK